MYGGVSSERIWTGSNSNGTKKSGNELGATQVALGEMASGKEMNNGATFGKTDIRNLYGLSPVITVRATVDAGAVPAAPSGFRAAPGHEQVTLNWGDPSDSNITGYRFRQKAGSGGYGGWMSVPNSSATTTEHIVTGLTNGTVYRFQVRAVNTVGNGAPSVEAIATPGVVAVLTDWNLIPAGINPGDNFRLLFVTSTLGRELPTANIGAANAIVQARADANALLQPFKDGFRALISTSEVDARDNTETAPAGTAYTTNEGVPIFWVNGAKVADDYADFYDGSWDSSPYTVWKTENGDQTITNFDKEVWTGSDADGTRHATAYAGADPVQYGWLGGGTISDNSSDARTSSEKGLAYYGLSPVITVQPVAADAPAKPANLTATAGEEQVTLRWDNPNDSGITGYQYQQKAGIGNYGSWRAIPGSGSLTTRFTTGSLTAGTVYKFKVRARNAGGSSLPSEEVMAAPVAKRVVEAAGLVVVPAETAYRGSDIWIGARRALSSGEDTITLSVRPVAPAREGINYRLSGPREVVIKDGQMQSEEGLSIYPMKDHNAQTARQYHEVQVTGRRHSDNAQLGPVTVRIWDAGARPPEPWEQEVPATSPLIPTDAQSNPLFGPGEGFRLLFVTTAKTQAASWEIEDYNDFVQAVAAGASGNNEGLAAFSGQFRALVSTLLVDAYNNTWSNNFDRFSRVQSGYPIYWAGGEKVADGYPDFYDGTWDSPQARTEAGTAHDKAVPFFTGSHGGGRADPTAFAGADEVRVGKFDWTANDRGQNIFSNTNVVPLARDVKPETEFHPLLALSPLIRVVQPPTVTLRLSPASISENGGTTTLTARQNQVSGEDTTLTVEVEAAPSGSFTLADALTVPTGLSLTIPAGQTESNAIVLTGVDNDTDAPDKAVSIAVIPGTIANAHVGAVAGPAVTLTIEDDEPMPIATLVLTRMENGVRKPATRISENGGTLDLHVILDRPSSKPVRVTVSTPLTLAEDIALKESGSTSPAQKYVKQKRTFLVVLAGETKSSATYSKFVEAIDNNTYCPPEHNTYCPPEPNTYCPRERTYTVLVEGVTIATGGNPIVGPEPVTFTIVDDEEPPQFRLELDPAATISEGGYNGRVYARFIPRENPNPRRPWLDSLNRDVKLKVTVTPVSVHATEGDVYFRGGSTMTLPRHGRDGQVGYVRMGPVNNSKDEIDKRFTVSATFVDSNGNPDTDPALGSDPAPLTLTITDDDCCQPPRLRSGSLGTT